MKVVFLNPSAQLGGAERVLLDVMASIRSMEPSWELHLIASDAGPLVDRATALGAGSTVLRFPETIARLGDAGVRGAAGDRVGRAALLLRVAMALPSVGAYLFRLRCTLKRLKPDIVHTNGFKMHFLGILSGRGFPVVWHLHDYVSSRPVMSRLLKRYRGRCAAVIANSNSVAKDLRETLGEGLEIHPVYNAVDLQVFTPDGPAIDLDELSGFDPADAGTVRVGLIATLGRWKGQADFLRAISLLPSDLKIRGYVIGGAVYQTGGSQYALKDLKDLAERLGVSDRVGFTGFVSQPAQAMRALDIVVHASTHAEPFGMVIAEAMACGRATIASRMGGSAELFTSGEDAIGYRPGKAEQLSECINQLARDPELRSKLGTQGRLTAVRRYDRTRLAKELVPVYLACAGRTA